MIELILRLTDGREFRMEINKRSMAFAVYNYMKIKLNRSDFVLIRGGRFVPKNQVLEYIRDYDHHLTVVLEKNYEDYDKK
jgi:hypothetical protein